jgi:hypothetical protein
MVLACTITSVGQNYLGMSQSKIIKIMGEPEFKGENYFIYNDCIEKGENIYYFDENENCKTYVLVRNNDYFAEYHKILNREFTKASENRFLKKVKKVRYVAEITTSQNEFQILIQLISSPSDTSEKISIANY